MKIFYAANSFYGSQYQLDNVVGQLKNKHQIKTSGYSFFKNHENLNYCLDNLNVNLKTRVIETHFRYLLKIISDFQPDVILSELNVPLSFAGQILKIPVIQISPLLMYYGLDKKTLMDLKIDKKYITALDKIYSRDYREIIEKSFKNLAISPFCDTINPLKLTEGFDYIRSDFWLDPENRTSNENIAVVMDEPDKVLYFQKKNTPYWTEDALGKNKVKYQNNLTKCNYLMHQGYTSLVADCFYNQRQSIFSVRPYDPESVLNYHLSEHFKVGQKFHSEISEMDIKFKINNKVSFLSDIFIA